MIVAMRAAIIAVGSELLGIDRLDTNSLSLTRVLHRFGVELVGKSVVGDSRKELAYQVRSWAPRADLIMMTGGLGPTADDLTREVVAEVLGLELREDPAIVEDIREKFRAFGRPMPESNRKQAQVPVGAKVLANPRGTAPGLLMLAGGDALESETTIFLFPGVPSELEHMIEADLEPWLEERATGIRMQSRTVRVGCRSESAVEEDLEPLYREFGQERITVLAAPGDIQVRFNVAGSVAEAGEVLDLMVARARAALGRAVYAVDEPESLEAVVGALLFERGLTLAVAESCTGGLISERLTRVPGSSRYFEAGLATYSNAAKEALLGVPGKLLAAAGAVSEDVARAMATGVRTRMGTDVGLSVTGVAGPGGGTEDKPVGTVHVGLAGDHVLPSDEHRLLKLTGDRERIRLMTSQWALEWLRRSLLAE